jgi:hypothetical protein
MKADSFQITIVLMLKFYLGLLPNAYGQDSLGNFLPPAIPSIVYAIQTKQALQIDGKLSEPAWQAAPVIDQFFRQEPRQGGTVKFKTEVKLLYDDKNLYAGVWCADPNGKKGLRAQDLRRDFSYGENDIFYMQLDPQNLKQYCVSFQTTPWGNQRDKQVFNDAFNDQDWDAMWRVRTHITDSGWYAEFAIPFKSIRYDIINGEDVSWGITFARLARKEYEQSVFPAIPQSFTAYRMTYAAQLKGLQLPAAGSNVRIQPYGLMQFTSNRNAQSAKATNTEWKAGGEVKWAINPRAVLDLTFNTDFAQADVDRAVNNLTRFNVFFPERRQFFLENSGVYAGADVTGINPFFSRTIGLADAQFNADPVPINVGARFTDRSQQRTWAGLYVRQRATEFQPAVDFGVARYLKNYGTQNNAGAMLTHKIDNRDMNGNAARVNTTLTMDGLIRPKDVWTITYMASASRDNTNDSIGFAGNFFAAYAPNDWYIGWVTKYVDKLYRPGMGFVFQNDVIWHNPIAYKIIRPKGKLGKIIRRLDPGFAVNYYQQASNLRFQSADLDIFPLYTVFSDNSVFNISFEPAWEHFFFQPLGIAVAPGKYQFNRWSARYNSDASKKISGNARYAWGEYYDGNLNIVQLGARFAPIPHIAATFEYEQQQIKNLGINRVTQNNNLFTTGIRLALNPRLQVSGFYQYNSFNNQSRWNMRGSWEFAPLSFIYIVFNENSFTDSRVRNQSVINKITWLKQF